MGAPKRTTKSWGLREHLADSSSPYSISLPSFDAESVEVALTSEELAEEHWLCPARDHHISAPLVLPGRAGNGDFRKLPTPPLFLLQCSPLVNIGSHQPAATGGESARQMV